MTLGEERPTPSGPDPFQVLGLTSSAGAEEIRAAYLRRVKEHPPDRSPEEFERIRDAHGILSDPRRRAELLLLSADPRAPLESLLHDRRPERKHVDLEAWLAVLKERP